MECLALDLPKERMMFLEKRIGDCLANAERVKARSDAVVESLALCREERNALKLEWLSTGQTEYDLTQQINARLNG